MVFRIRNAQIEMFARSLEARFAERAARRLRRAFPAQVEEQQLDDKQLEALALEGLAESKVYGVINEADVLRYVECKLLLGPKFDRDSTLPWAGQTLRRSDWDGEAKMDRIDDYLIFVLRTGS